MSTPSPTPSNPQQFEDYLRQYAAQQSNTTGLTQTAPSTAGAQAPTPRPVRPQQEMNPVQAYGPGQGGARRANDMQNLVKSGQNLVSQISQAHNAKQQREYQQTIGKFNSSLQGIQQAQAQSAQADQMMQQAAAKLKANPDDSDAKGMIQQAGQMKQSAQTALKQNQLNLNDISQDKKQSKIISKAYGIDDKNANSPERQALIQSLQKQMGVGPQAAGQISRLPQTQQLSPQAQQQQQLQQAGVVGKPATQGQIIGAQTQLTKTGMTEEGKNTRASARDQLTAQLNGQKYDDSGKLVPMTSEEIKSNPVLSAKIGTQQAKQQLEQAQTQLTQMRTSALPEQVKLQEARVSALQGNLMMRQKEFGIKVQEEERKQLETVNKIGEARTLTTPEGGSVDIGQMTGGRPLQSWAQQTVVQTQDRLSQVNGLMQKIEDMGLKDNNQSGYLALDRLGYAMGHASPEGELGSEISNIELQKVVNAATILKGSSRAYASLQQAMIHTPDAWKDSPQLMYQKLKTIQSNLQDMQRDAIAYGQKGERSGEMPAQAPRSSTPTPKQSAPTSADPLGILN